MATTVFRSTSWSLDWPIAEPSDRRFRIILKQNGADISGGQAIEADKTAFTVHEERQREGFDVYWRVQPTNGRRVVVVDQGHGWRGDWYAVFLPNETATYDQFTAPLRARETAQLTDLNPELGDGRWNPPIVLADASSGADWLIDRGEPYEVMPDWRVHGVTAKGLNSPCRISFGDDAHKGLRILPAAVRTIAAALDEALGPGNNEGTLQPTARIRLETERGWANAAVRPWALSGAPYNDRGDVDRNLAKWAGQSRPRAALLRRIRLAYPAAERALSSYYRARFQMSARAAEVRGSHVMDYMYRSYFVFSADPG